MNSFNLMFLSLTDLFCLVFFITKMKCFIISDLLLFKITINFSFLFSELNFVYFICFLWFYDKERMITLLLVFDSSVVFVWKCFCLYFFENSSSFSFVNFCKDFLKNYEESFHYFCLYWELFWFQHALCYHWDWKIVFIWD